MIRIIIAGSRTFNNYPLLKKTLDECIYNLETDEEIQIVSGGARGADKLGERYAKERGYSLKIFPADWNRYGKRAGFLRNNEMAEYADCLAAFWDNQSRGTKHMIDLAVKHKLKVCVTSF